MSATYRDSEMARSYASAYRAALRNGVTYDQNGEPRPLTPKQRARYERMLRVAEREGTDP